MNEVLRSAVGFCIRLNPARIILVSATFATLAVSFVSLASAQAPEVRITELQCNSDPEVVTISNQGSAPQDLTGWTLRSDPVGFESFELSAIGVLGSGVSVFVQSGPGANGSYVWSSSQVLRDSDAADFARIVNTDGAVVHEVKCQAGSPAATTAAPTAQPTATPTTAPIDEVPVGGGPPGGGSWESAGLMLAAGSWLLAAVFGTVVVARLRAGRPQAVIASDSQALPVQAIPAVEPAAGGGWFYLLLVLLLAAIAGLSRGSDTHSR